MKIKLFELADNILELMIQNPLEGYNTETRLPIINEASEFDITNTFALLRSRGYVKFPINTQPGKPSGDVLYITNEGGDFILSGGFAEQIKREKLKTDEIVASTKAAEAACKMAVFQKRAMKVTIAIATLTLIALIGQLLYQYCRIS